MSKAPAVATIEIDQLCKVLLSGNHAPVVNHHAEPLKAMVHLISLFSLLDDAWDIVLMGIIEYTEKNGKTPDVKGVSDYMGRSPSALFTQSFHKVIDLEKMLEDVEVLTEDPAVLIEHTIQQVNLAAFKEISMNSYAIATGVRVPAQCLAMKKPSGLADAQTYFNLGCTKLVGTNGVKSGIWHEHADEIADALMKPDKYPLIKTGFQALDEGWPIRRGKTLLIQAASGDGKTSLLQTIMYNAATRGQNVLVDSLEAKPDEFWEMLAFIHQEREGGEKRMSLSQWKLKRDSGSLSDVDRRWMQGIIDSIKARDKVPGLIDIVDIRNWSKLVAYLQTNHPKNQYDILVVDYFGAKFETPGARDRSAALNQLFTDAVNFVETFDDGRLLLMSPALVKRESKTAADNLYVDSIADSNLAYGFESFYPDANCIRGDVIPSLTNDAALVIGIWSDKPLKDKRQGLICCSKCRGIGRYFPTFRFSIDPSSGYIRQIGRVPVEGGSVTSTERSIRLSSKHLLKDEL